MNMEQSNKINPLIILALLASVVIVGFFVWNWVDLKEKQLKIEAIQGCSQVATGVETSGWIYKVCVEDKGYRTQIK